MYILRVLDVSGDPSLLGVVVLVERGGIASDEPHLVGVKQREQERGKFRAVMNDVITLSNLEVVVAVQIADLEGERTKNEFDLGQARDLCGGHLLLDPGQQRLCRELVVMVLIE